MGMWGRQAEVQSISGPFRNQWWLMSGDVFGSVLQRSRVTLEGVASGLEDGRGGCLCVGWTREQAQRLVLRPVPDDSLHRNR